jgi:hypothetical protein
VAFTLVQQKTAMSAVSGTAITCTFDSPPTEGNLLLGILFHTGTNEILTDSSWAGGHWWVDFESCMVYHYPKIASPGQSSTLSNTSPSSVTWAVCLLEYAGDGIIADDTADGELFTSSGQLTYTLATNGNDYPATGRSLAYANDLVVVSFGHQGATRSIASWSNGFTELADLAPAGTVLATLGVAHKILTTAGISQSCTVTLSANSTAIPVMYIQSFTTYPSPSRARASQQSSPAGW